MLKLSSSISCPCIEFITHVNYLDEDVGVPVGKCLKIIEGHDIFLENFNTVLGTNISNLWQRENLFRFGGNGIQKLGPVIIDY